MSPRLSEQNCYAGKLSKFTQQSTKITHILQVVGANFQLCINTALLVWLAWRLMSVFRNTFSSCEPCLDMEAYIMYKYISCSIERMGYQMSPPYRMQRKAGLQESINHYTNLSQEKQFMLKRKYTNNTKPGNQCNILNLPLYILHIAYLSHSVRLIWYIALSVDEKCSLFSTTAIIKVWKQMTLWAL